jgi:hypothetical protein
MTTRTAGRHRSTKSTPPDTLPPSLLLVDYLESGQFTGPRFTSGPRVTTPPQFPGRQSTGGQFTGSGFRGRQSTGQRFPGGQFTAGPSAPTRRHGRSASRVSVNRSASRLSTSRFVPRLSADRFASPLSADRFASRVSVNRFASRLSTSRFVPRLPVNRRMLAIGWTAVLAVLALTAILGGYVLLHSPATSGRRHPTSPPASSPLSVPPPSATPTTPATPATPKPPHHDQPHRTLPSHPAPSSPLPPSAAQPQPSTTAGPRPSVAVRYLIASQGPAGFQAEIQVTNNTPRPISGWQVVVALPDDQILSFSNATGYASNGILLLHPAATTLAIPPNGTQDIFFIAEGTETTPEACAFNNVVCT